MRRAPPPAGPLLALCALVAAALLAVPAAAQPPRTAPIVANGDSTYLVIVGRDTLLAITGAMMKASLRLKADLDAAQAKLGVQDATISGFDTYRTRADSLIALDSAQIALQKDQIRDLRDEVATLKKLLARANPLLTLQAGAGITTKGLGVIGGIGFRRLRVLATLQEEGSGVYAGFQFPITW